MMGRLIDMSRIARFFIGGIALLLTVLPDARAADDVVVRLEARPENPWVGQKVVLLLDVLGRDGWAQLKQVHGHELQGGYLRRFESQGTRLQEGAYTGQRYEYLFFPQRAGELSIDSMDIDVEVKRWGAEPANEIVRTLTPAVKLDVRMPAGVESARDIVSTSRFTASQKWEPQQTELQAGDAVTRTVVFEAVDVSGMVLPALDAEPAAGVGVYPKSPLVDDRYSRGSLTGVREETITYVMEQPGSHELDALTFSWWNIETEEIGSVTLDGRTFNVAAVQGTDESEAAADLLPAGKDRRLLWGLAGLSVLILLCSLLWRLVLRARYLEWKARAAQSERNYFARVKHASGGSDPSALMNAAIQWLDRISDEGRPPRLDRFAERYGTTGDVEKITGFSGLAWPKEPAREMKLFYETLVRLRTNWLTAEKQRSRQQNADQILPPIGIQ